MSINVKYLLPLLFNYFVYSILRKWRKKNNSIMYKNDAQKKHQMSSRQTLWLIRPQRASTQPYKMQPCEISRTMKWKLTPTYRTSDVTNVENYFFLVLTEEPFVLVVRSQTTHHYYVVSQNIRGISQPAFFNYGSDGCFVRWFSGSNAVVVVVFNALMYQ